MGMWRPRRELIDNPRLLYYFTDRAGLAALLAAGQLDPHPLAYGHHHADLGQPILLLTEDRQVGPTAELIARLPAVEVRLAVAAVGVQRWSIWSDRYRVPRGVQARLDEACEGLSERLWVSTRPVPTQDWLIADDVITGEALWRAPAAVTQWVPS